MYRTDLYDLDHDIQWSIKEVNITGVNKRGQHYSSQ